ncbi:RING finger protein 214 [Polymixia lowei]
MDVEAVDTALTSGGNDSSHLNPEETPEPSMEPDSGAGEKGMNTEPDWEAQIADMMEQGSRLAEQYSSLLKQKEQQEAQHNKHKQQLEKKKEDAVRQHQALLDKLESLRVKLQLNDSKATRKIFLAKKQDMTSERNRAEEERSRLAKDLEESERRLTSLMDEQAQEKHLWEHELEELKQEMERVRKEAEGAELAALQDEVAALEKHREVTMVIIEAWLQEVGQYLNALRLDHTQQHLHERLKWEKQECLVRKNQEELQNRFQETLQQLRQGHELESLPKITAPSLPKVPTVDLIISQMMLSLNHVSFPPPPPNVGILPVPHHQPPYHPHLQPHLQPHHRAPVRVTPPPNPSPSPPVQSLRPVAPPPSLPPAHTPPPPATSAPAGKLDKLLEKLGAKFPQCTRAQLMSVLQQIKSSRGTMAGMSMEDVTEQVGLKLAHSERLAPGPISRPNPAVPRGFPGPHAPVRQQTGPVPGPAHPPQRPAGGQALHNRPAAGSRKLCLMCQNHVDLENQYPLSCSHTLHRDCISVWLQSSKNNPCPFCPFK